MTVYLCGGINGLTDSAAKGWREEAKKSLLCKTLDPMRRDYRGVEDQNVEAIVSGDIQDIERSDALLVNANRPSWGTAMEIHFAALLRKPVYAFCSGRVSPWLRFHCTEVLTTMADCIGRLNRFAE